MTLKFIKYQATGNDFIIVDNRQNFFDKNNTKLISNLCDRRFGIGADGFILLENVTGFDFKMIYFNSDGQESTMCGNGGRSIVHFANYLGIIKNKATFLAIDGPHDATIKSDNIALKMLNVLDINHNGSAFVLDTGSPHYVELRLNLNDVDVASEGAAIRYSPDYKSDGINVNFVQQIQQDVFSVRTYERGVEAETFSCGTGATAVAISMHSAQKTQSKLVTLLTKGGELKVQFKIENGAYTDVWLIGPAKKIYEGTCIITKETL